MVGDGERTAVSAVAGLELALEVRDDTLCKYAAFATGEGNEHGK
jgi:hypothetical protein